MRHALTTINKGIPINSTAQITVNKDRSALATEKLPIIIKTEANKVIKTADISETADVTVRTFSGVGLAKFEEEGKERKAAGSGGADPAGGAEEGVVVEKFGEEELAGRSGGNETFFKFLK